MKRGYTHISVVLDRSGSMASCLDDTIGGFNSFLGSQRELDGEATLSLIQFDDQYEILEDMKAIGDCKDITVETYVPRGMTALLDAIGRTINNTEAQLDNKDEDEKPEKVIFVIITDGAENHSTEFNHEQIMKMINRHREDNKWEFVFIGANQDAISVGGGMGVRAANSLTYDQSQQGTTHMYMSLTRGMNNYRSKSVKDLEVDSDFFNQEDRDVQDVDA